MQMPAIIRKIRGRLRKPIFLPPMEQRSLAVLQDEGIRVSVEKALNSRCTSDYDDDPTIGHWGMFDKDRRLSKDQILRIASLSRIPRFTEYTCEIRPHEDILSFVVDADAKGVKREILMIESGMQQQAVGLVCAALGVGTLFQNMGTEGKPFAHDALCTTDILIGPMKPSYQGLFWSVKCPEGENPWVSGNLPDPRRDGPCPLLTALSDLPLSDKSTLHSTITVDELGQLCWAAKGRSPHFYKSIPWGMTVPTWDGTVESTSVYLCNKHGLHKYCNWRKRRPTHSLTQIPESNGPLFSKLKAAIPEKENYILFKTDVSAPAALWEIGYSLMNVTLQMRAMSILGDTIFPKRTSEGLFVNSIFGVPEAMVAI